MSEPIPGTELSEDERRNAFRDELRLTTEDGAGRIVGRIPKKFLYGGLAAMAVLGIGGQAVEHYFGNLGLPSTSSTTTTVATAPRPTHASTGPVAAATAVLRLKLMANVAAPNFTLTDQHGHAFGLRQARGRVTLVTFFDKNCNDICPVLGRELHLLLDDLGTRANTVNILVVNTDPFSYAASKEPAALSTTGLASRANVHFLTGTLATLDSVWKAYGVEVRVGVTAAQVGHNSLIYFVSPNSQLLGFATPYAHVSSTGAFPLDASAEARFAEALRFETVSLNQ